MALLKLLVQPCVQLGMPLRVQIAVSRHRTNQRTALEACPVAIGSSALVGETAEAILVISHRRMVRGGVWRINSLLRGPVRTGTSWQSGAHAVVSRYLRLPVRFSAISGTPPIKGCSPD